MIVKNEREAIRRSLGSIKRIIDYWVIVDTGSTDGTQKIIKDFMKDLPGELYERPWVNFETNRNEALQFARNKSDYILFMDADEEFVFAPDFALGDLDKDLYVVQHRLSEEYDFQRISIINNDPDWKWVGVIHEAIFHPRIENLSVQVLSDVINIYHTTGGGRAQNPNKCLDDAAILERELQKDPNHSRNMFYLAQSYFEAKEYLRALQIYEKRSRMEGSASELFWSLYRVALIQQFHIQCQPETYLYSYAKAFEQRPERIEPLYYIAHYYCEKGKYRINYWILKLALAIPKGQETILVERWMTDWGIPYQLIQSAYNIGRYREAYDGSVALLAGNHLPSDQRKALEQALPLIKIKADPTSPF